MTDMKNIIFLALLLIASSADASCPGLTGEDLAVCECQEKALREKALPIVSEAYTCKKDSDCEVVDGPCGWISLSKSWNSKNKFSFNKRLLTSKSPAKSDPKCVSTYMKELRCWTKN